MSTRVQGPLISIALPTVNRPRLLDRAIAQLRAQTYDNLEILVSDNASTDPDVAAVAQKHCREDGRVAWFRQETNIGAYGNYIDSMSRTSGDYVMWAADDDQWSPDFVTELYGCLQANPKAGFAFGGMEIVNLDDKVIGRLDRFSRFTSTNDRLADARRFLLEDEIGGKSNPIYGLYRRGAVIDTIDRLWRGHALPDDIWSGDVVFVFSAMIRHGFIGMDKVLFRKSKPTRRDNWVSYRPHWYSRGVPLAEYGQYTAALQAAVDDPAIKVLVAEVMRRRRFKEIFLAKPVRPFAKLLERLTKDRAQ